MDALRKQFSITGSSTTDKLKSIEQFMRSFQRRLHKTVVYGTPMLPILTVTPIVPESGIVTEFVSPLGGTIQVLAIACSKTTAINVELSIRRGTSTTSKIYKHDRNVGVFRDISLPIEPGDIVTVKTTDYERVSNFLCSLLIDPVQDAMRKEQYLIDSLLSITEATETETTV